MNKADSFLECFALEPTIAQLQARLPTLSGAERIAALTSMAWHLRQRDSYQALKLADYAAQLNQESTEPDAIRDGWNARHALVRAEIASMSGASEEAEEQLAVARGAFDGLGDKIGAGDAEAVAASIAWGGADHLTELSCWKKALEHYAASGDAVRRDFAAARIDLWLAQRSRGRSLDAYGDAALELTEVDGAKTAARSEHPAVAAIQLGAQGFRFEGSCDHAHKAVAFARASRLAAEAGLIRFSIVAAARTAQGFLDLGDTEAASVWSDQAYSLARKTGWPGPLAKCHIVFASLLHRIGSLERSRDVFRQALPLAGGHLGRCQLGLARTLLDLGSFEEALQLLVEAAENAEKSDDAVTFCGIELERARALNLLGRPVEASEQIARALARAKSEAITAFDLDLLEAQADVHSAGRGPGVGPSEAAKLLLQAIEIGSRQPGWQPPPALLIKLARAQAAEGDLSSAVTNYERSITATDMDLARRVRDRVAAAHAQEEIERFRREAEEHQMLARAESSRADDLQAMLEKMRETQATLARRTEELERLSMLDALTGIPNRRHLDERAAAEMALMRRKSTLLALVLFDLDHFKMVNDTYGHAAGDIVLRTVAETARSLLRPSDFIARIGGEEFTLLLPRTSLQGAATIADRIRQALMALNIVYAEFRIPVTASFGVTLLAESDDDISDAMSRADIALYRAKRDGRNMVRIEAV